MKKTYRLEVDCANCANLIEAAVSKLPEIADVSVSFITQKISVEYRDGYDPDSVREKIGKICRKIDPDCKMYG